MKKERNLLKHFSVLGIGTIISIIIGLLNTPVITRLVTPEVFGEYNTFLTYGTVIVNIIYLGLDQGLIRYFYEDDSKEYKRSLLFKTVNLPIILYVVGILLFFFVYYLIDPRNLSTELLVYFLFHIFILLIQRFSMLVLRLQYKSKSYSFLNIFKKISYLVIAFSVIVIFDNKSAIGLILAVIISELLITLIGIYWERDLWNFTLQKKQSISSKKLLKYSLPFLFTMLLTSIFDANDKIFLQKYANFHTIGVFSSAQSLVAVVNLIQNTFNTVWAPAQIEHYTSNPDDTEYYIKANDIMTIIMFLVAILMILFKDISAYFLGVSYREAVLYLPTLLFGPVMYTISETTVGGIVFKEKSYYHLIISIIIYIFDVLSNFILVPRLGAAGAAISTGLSYIAYFYLRTYISNKLFPINFKLRRINILILSVFIFALYATFNSFNLIILLGFIFNLLLIYFLYRETINYYFLFGIKLLVNKIGISNLGGRK